MNNKTRNMTQSALFMSLGIVFPILFHASGLGAVFLPMFWPMAIAAFYLPFVFILVTGLCTPLLSMLLTGMPPFPVVFIMMIEIPVMMSAIYLTRKWMQLGTLPTLFIAFIFSRIALFFSILIFGTVLGISENWLSWAYILKGLPGIITMLIFITILMFILKKEPFLWRKPNVSGT